MCKVATRAWYHVCRRVHPWHTVQSTWVASQHRLGSNLHVWSQPMVLGITAHVHAARSVELMGTVVLSAVSKVDPDSLRPPHFTRQCSIMYNLHHVFCPACRIIPDPSCSRSHIWEDVHAQGKAACRCHTCGRWSWPDESTPM